MPIIVEYTYEDGTTERKKYPAKIWRKDDNKVQKILTSNKALKSIVLDPDLETADVDVSNNSWPKEEKSEVATAASTIVLLGGNNTAEMA